MQAGGPEEFMIVLSKNFHAHLFYMDVDSIELGEDFFDAIDEALSTCGVLLPIIGRNWLDASDAYGRRIDNPDDLVRHEITSALKSNVRVIPILVDGATIPKSTDLPENLAPMVRRNAFAIRHESFHSDTERLIKAIQTIVKAKKQTFEEQQRKIEEEQRKIEEHVQKTEVKKPNSVKPKTKRVPRKGNSVYVKFKNWLDDINSLDD